MKTCENVGVVSSYICQPQSWILLNKKQKKPFVSLKDEVTITQSFFTAALLAQLDNALNEADSNLFCRDTRGLDSRSVKSFFWSVFLLLSKTFFVSL